MPNENVKKVKTTIMGRNLESPKCKRQNVQEETDQEWRAKQERAGRLVGAWRVRGKEVIKSVRYYERLVGSRWKSGHCI